MSPKAAILSLIWAIGAEDATEGRLEECDEPCAVLESSAPFKPTSAPAALEGLISAPVGVGCAAAFAAS